MIPSRIPQAPLQTAVLFLVFNRPDTTAQVLEAIRQAQPARLYVAADGPREGREGEAKRVASVREIATAVDWPCEVKTLFHRENLGCKEAPQSGISWFFEHEPCGIILEDDCLPHPDFFPYCEYCLREFEDVPSVWHINGNNFAADRSLYNGYGMSFISLAQVWGWASWADRWEKAEKNIFYLREQSREGFKRWNLSRVARAIKYNNLRSLARGLDTWDYQWQISILNKGGCVVSPSSNLISNLGDGPDATHTKSDRHRMRLPVEPLLQYSHPNVSVDRLLTDWYELKMGLRRSRAMFRSFPRSTLSHAQALAKRAVQKILFLGVKPIVIASSGRAGSTMLTSAIAESLVRRRFAVMPGMMRKFFKKLAVDYLDRIEGIGKHSAPVLKTHDLYRSEFARCARYIFIFGDPLESAQSVEKMGNSCGQVWVEEHIYHLAGSGGMRQIYERDVLNYEAQLQAWRNLDGGLVVHYDDLWDKRDDLSSFLGFDLWLPNRRERAKKELPKNYNKALFDRLKELEQRVRSNVP